MEFKGTKGEWRVAEIYPDTSKTLDVLEHCIGVKDEDMRSMAICGEVNNPEAKANAQLIAAAPDLLRELKRMTLSMQAHPDCEPDSEFQDYVDSAWEVIEKATEL